MDDSYIEGSNSKEQIEEENEDNINPQDDRLFECSYIFGNVDSNKDGKVTALEAIEIMQTTGVYPTQTDITNLFNKLGISQSSELTLEQINEMMKIQMSNSPDNETSIVNSFKVFDPDNTGYIQVDDLRRAIKAFGGNLKEKDINEMIKRADPGNKKKIKYEEYVHNMMNV